MAQSIKHAHPYWAGNRYPDSASGNLGSDRHMLLMRHDERLRGNDDIALNRLFSYRNWRLSLYSSCKTRVTSKSTDSRGLFVAR